MKSSQGVSERRVLYLNAASAEERAWAIAVEERAPGTLAASIALASWSGPDSLLKLYIKAAYETAESAFYDNPNRYRCTRA